MEYCGTKVNTEQLVMAEYDVGGVDMSYDGDGVGLRGAGGVSSDEEYETMTAAAVLEKLEEV